MLDKLDQLLFKYQSLQDENKTLKKELLTLQDLKVFSSVNSAKKVRKTEKNQVKKVKTPSLF